MNINAQYNKDKHFTREVGYSSDFRELIASDIARDLSVRDARCEVLPAAQYLVSDTEQAWCNGLDIMTTFYNPKAKRVERSYYGAFGQGPFDGISGDYELVVKGGNVSVKGKPALKVSIEKYGNYVMMVFRNAQGQPVKAYYHFDFDEARNTGKWTRLIHYLLAGNYPLGDEQEHSAVFGPRMSFYTGYKYDEDPGIYDLYIDGNTLQVSISYGAGRASHGDPSSPKYGKMPGGGGAAALMGPMEWEVTPTIQGIDINVTHDQKFVDHNPRVGNQGDKRSLTKAQGPYEGLDGKWTFASVIPLTPTLLKIFPKEMLKYMRGEIYARYGDTFADPDTQAYFDAQPWYHKQPGKKITLTDIERYNYAVIKMAEATAK